MSSLPTRTLFGQIASHAKFTPVKPAIMLPDRVITYEMLEKGIYSVQLTLAQLGIDREAPVAIVIDNPGRHIIVLLALIRSGYAAMSIRRDQVSLAVSFGAKLLLTDEQMPIPVGLRLVSVDDKWFLQRISPPPGAYPVSPDRIARIEFTSGSTGIPKAVGVTYRALHARIHEIYLIGIASESRYLTTYGLSGSLFSYGMRVLSGGNTLVLAPIEHALAMAQNVRVDAIRSSVSQARALIEMQASSKVQLRLAQFTTGGGPLSDDMADELVRTFHAEIISTYSSTEGSHMALAAGELMNVRRRKGNCFAPFARIEIVDENDEALPPGNEGRIRVQSSTMVWNYNGSLVESEDVRAREPWFYPGDLGLFDEDGLLIVTGRADEVINFGGSKFAPEIIEESLRHHPALKDFAVVRMSNGEAWLATPAAVSVSADEINAWIPRNLAGERAGVKIARVATVDSIPVAPNGKVLRGELRRLLQSSM